MVKVITYNSPYLIEWISPLASRGEIFTRIYIGKNLTWNHFTFSAQSKIFTETRTGKLTVTIINDLTKPLFQIDF